MGPPFLFSQTDTIKKSFKPYGLIDAAPVAISKEDFKPQIDVTIRAEDAISNLPLEARFNYYTSEDTAIKTGNGNLVSLIINPNEKITIVSNAKGYIGQSLFFDVHDSDTAFVLKFSRLKKGDIVTIHICNFSLHDNKIEPCFYADLLELKEFLKLNPSVKIEIIACPKTKKIIHSYLIKSFDKQRFHVKSCGNQKGKNYETITIKILRI